MVSFIALFAPAVIAVWIVEAICRKAFTRRQWLYHYCLGVILINGLCFAVKKWILHTADPVITGLAKDMSPSIACNYLIMAMGFAVVIALLLAFIRKHVGLILENNEDYSEVSDDNTNSNPQ